MYYGVDFAAHVNAQTAQELYNAGYRFVCRYFGYGSKITDKAECRAISDANLRILCVWENRTDDYKSGKGRIYGAEAKRQAEAIGMPHSAIIYCAIDTDATMLDTCAAYLTEFAEAIRPYRLGVYGGYKTVEEMHKRGIGDAYWQTIAWSYGRISDHMTVYQYTTSHKECGISVDNDRCEDMDAAGMWQLPEEVNGMIYDISGLKAQYIKPGTSLAKWLAAQQRKPKALMNFSLYEGKNTPIGTIIEGDKLVHDAGNGYGIGIVNGELGFGNPWTKAWEYFASGYTACVVDGKYVAPSFNDSYVFGCRLNRIGLGRKSGKWYIVTADAVTLQGFAEYAIRNGFDTLVNADGGGSRFLYYGGKTVHTSVRTPYNALAFYGEGNDVIVDNCPYKRPTGNVKRGSVGEGAKWVQWKLNQRGYSLTVDGIIGSKSVNAITDFQRRNGLTADGIAGKITLGVLDNG